jgi:shikimate kinase
MKNIVLIGMKNCGKSTLSKLIAAKFAMPVVESDRELEQLFCERSQQKLTTREIHKLLGAEGFRDLETETLKMILEQHPNGCVIDLGGGAPLRAINRKIIKQMGTIVCIMLNPEVNFSRLMSQGISPILKDPDNPWQSFELLLKERLPIYKALADFTIELNTETPEQVLGKFRDLKLL